jgi:hypothetical protein
MLPALRALGLLALGSLLALPARGAEETRPLDLWPLVVRDGRSVAGRQVIRLGGPLFERWRTTEDERGWTLRPFAAGLETPERRSLEFLFPLGEIRRSEEGSRMRLTPFLDRTERPASPEEGGKKKGWTFLLAFGGTTDGGERYGGVFPFGGIAKQRFGLERLDFLLFPLFARSRDDHGFTRTHFLWPFFSWGSGGGRSLMRFWPLGGWDRREGEYERKFALWPFFHWRTERLGEPAERKVRLFLPFYGDSRSSVGRSRMIGGPLYMSSEKFSSQTRSTDLLWPLIRVAKTPAREGFEGASEIKFEPFFRLQRAPGFSRTSALLGAINHSESRRGTTHFEGWRFLYVNRFERLHDQGGGREMMRRDLWPLFTYRDGRAAGGERRGTLRAPWVVPIVGEGFSRHLLGLATFYEARWLDDEHRADLFWGLARSRRAAGYRLDAFSWLLRRERLPGIGARWSFLGISFDESEGSL